MGRGGPIVPKYSGRYLTPIIIRVADYALPRFSDIPTALVTGTIGCRRCYRFHSTCMHMYILLILTYNGANNYLEMPIIHFFVENLAVFSSNL